MPLSWPLGAPYQWKWQPQVRCTSSGTVSGAAAGALPDEEPPIWTFCSSSSNSISTSRGSLHWTQVDIVKIWNVVKLFHVDRTREGLLQRGSQNFVGLCAYAAGVYAPRVNGDTSMTRGFFRLKRRPVWALYAHGAYCRSKSLFTV